MKKFGVTFVTDVYFEVDAEDEEEAMDRAYVELYETQITDYEWDCNECMDVSDWTSEGIYLNDESE